MVQFCLLWVNETTFLTTSKDLLKVQFLTYIGHIHDSFSLYFIHTVSEGSQISSSVAKATIGLLDHKWWGVLLANENASGALVLNSYLALPEFVNKRLQKWIVEALSLLNKLDVKPVVYLLEFSS